MCFTVTLIKPPKQGKPCLRSKVPPATTNVSILWVERPSECSSERSSSSCTCNQTPPQVSRLAAAGDGEGKGERHIKGTPDQSSSDTPGAIDPWQRRRLLLLFSHRRSFKHDQVAEESGTQGMEGGLIAVSEGKDLTVCYDVACVQGPLPKRLCHSVSTANGPWPWPSPSRTAPPNFPRGVPLAPAYLAVV